jgi:virulence factor Mce-like protein
MRRGIASGLAASPTLVGAVTVMIVVLAIFLAYNANTGLPFVPTYALSTEIPNANSLVAGNEVRIGGVRVGLVDTIEPEQNPEDGTVSAKLDLKLDADIEPLPEDSTLIVRSRSALGLKYLEIVKGTSEQGYPPGATIPITSYGSPDPDDPSRLEEPVEIDEVLSTFDEPTAVAIQDNLVEFGNALAGRGPALNSALGRLPRVLRYLEPVMTNLSDPDTGLERFVSASAAAASEVAPVADAQAELFVNLDTTFTALARVARPFIQETISETPPTFAVAERALPTIRPFLDHSAALFTELEPGAEALIRYTPQIADTLETGTPVLRDSPQLNRELIPTSEALLAFNDDEVVRDGLARLRQTTDISGPALRFITPAQTVCNYGTLFARNLAGTTAEGGEGSKWQRFSVFRPPEGPNNEGGVAAAPANGPGFANFLHFNPYPNTAAPGQPKECEAGNEPFLGGQQVIGNPPGNQGTVTAGQPGSESE